MSMWFYGDKGINCVTKEQRTEYDTVLKLWQNQTQWTSQNPPSLHVLARVLRLSSLFGIADSTEKKLQKCHTRPAGIVNQEPRSTRSFVPYIIIVPSKVIGFSDFQPLKFSSCMGNSHPRSLARGRYHRQIVRGVASSELVYYVLIIYNNNSVIRYVL